LTIISSSEPKTILQKNLKNLKNLKNSKNLNIKRQEIIFRKEIEYQKRVLANLENHPFFNGECENPHKTYNNANINNNPNGFLPVPFSSEIYNSKRTIGERMKEKRLRAKKLLNNLYDSKLVKGSKTSKVLSHTLTHVLKSSKSSVDEVETADSKSIDLVTDVFSDNKNNNSNADSDNNINIKSSCNTNLSNNNNNYEDNQDSEIKSNKRNKSNIDLKLFNEIKILRNRIAAQKSRDKRKEETNSIKNQYQNIIDENTYLKDVISNQAKELDLFKYQYKNLCHECIAKFEGNRFASEFKLDKLTFSNESRSSNKTTASTADSNEFCSNYELQDNNTVSDLGETTSRNFGSIGRFGVFWSFICYCLYYWNLF